MRQVILNLLVMLVTGTTLAAKSPSLILDAGPIDTSSAAQQTAVRALKESTRPATVQRLASRRGTAPWLVQFNDVIKEEWKKALIGAGATIRGYMPENGFVVLATPKQIRAIAQWPEVIYAGEYLPAYKRSRHVRQQMSQSETEAREYNIWLYDPADLDAIAAEIANVFSVTPHSSEVLPGAGRLRAYLPASALETITSWGEVEWVDPVFQRRVWNDVAVGTNMMAVTNVWSVLGLTGAGQTIAICDTGLDSGSTSTIHQDFTNRVTGFGWSGGAYSAATSWADTDGHGTHVAGSVGGSGAMSSGRYKGVAYGANIIFQGAQADLTGIPSNLGTLFKQAFDNGARIHSDSWGYDDNGYYNDDSRFLDMYVWSNKTFLVLVAAGNQGIDANSNGVVDLDSIGSPATAKNCLTVGAAETLRTTGGYAGNRYSIWGSDYPVAPISTDFISRPFTNNIQGMAAFSSRGPCDDGRIKPDIVANGTDIISTRSRRTSDTGWGLVTGNTNYMYMGGTSMATPLTAGAAGLVRQWLVTSGGITNPSAALMKAVMMNGARNMAPGQYGTGATQEIPYARPNNVQGWGHVDLYASLVPTAGRTMYLYDTNSLSNGQSNTFAYAIAAATTNKMVLTMAYSDYWGTAGSGKQLVNDLDLTVRKPSGTVVYANNRSSLDATNNVETIEFAPDEAGTYTVTVNARTVPSGGSQAYALVVVAPTSEAPVTGLDVSPSTSFAPAGPQGGPFSPTNAVYTLTNSSSSSLTWQARKDASLNWLNLSKTNGTLAAGATDTVTWSVNAVTASSLSNGTFSGLVTFTNITGGVALTRNASLTSRPVSAFVWNTIASPQTSGAPFDVTIRAVDALGATVTAFNSSAQLSGSVASTSTVGAGTGTWDFPLQTWYHDARTQVIYTPAEIGAAGPLSALALDVTARPGQSMQNFTIRMKHTTASANTVWDSSGWTTVYQSDVTVNSTGLNWFNFSTPFQYNGTNNLMVDFSFNNTTYTSNGLVRVSTGTSGKSITARSDSGDGDPLIWSGTSPTPSASANAPNLRLLRSSSFAISPTNTGAFSSGIWSGTVTVGAPVSNMTLNATSGSISDESNLFSVNEYAIVPAYGMRDDGGVNLPTVTYWHNGLGSDATQQGAAFAQNFGERTNFFIKGAAIKTWKNGGDVTGASFKYKIWNTAGAEPGSYTTRTVGFTSDDGNSNQTWAAFGNEINLLSGLNPGTYNIKILFDVTGTGTPGILTNGPFTASLTIPEPPVEIPSAPAAIWASETNATHFTAAWNASEGATSYRLDVGTHPSFEGLDQNLTLIDEDFVDITGWTSANTINNSSIFGAASPSMQMTRNASLISPAVNYPTQLVFFVDADTNDEGKTSTTYYSINNGSTWITINNFTVSSAGITITQPLPALANATNVRFRFVSSFNSWYLDDVKVTGLGAFSSKYVPGYSNLTVNGTSQSVTGLVLGATYYMRARAANTAGISSNSPVASVTTLEQIPDEPPVFAPVASQVATAGVTKVFSVSATGRPVPVVTLAASTASSGYSFNTLNGELTYTPPFADVGSRSFAFVASNTAGVVTQIVAVTVLPVAPAPPAAIWANNIGSSDFVVEWSAVDGADGYRLDVSESATFTGGVGGSGSSGQENFESFGGGSTSSYLTRIWTNNGITWTAYKARSDQTVNGSAAVCLQNAADSYFVSSVITGGVDSLWILSEQKFTGSDGTFDVFVNDIKVASSLPIATTNIVTTNIIQNIGVTGNFTIMVTNSGAVRVAFDDLTWTSSESSGGGFVSGYSNRLVTASSELVTGLAPESNYYFRVRAVNAQGTSSNSPTGTAATLPGDPVAPVFVPVAPQTAYVGRALSLFIEATGIPEPEIMLTNSTASSGYSFSPDTGRLTYQPPVGDLGPRTFTFLATNSASAVTQIVSVLVTNAPAEAPVIAAIPPQSMMLGSTLNYTVTATDADGSAFKFAATSTVTAATWSFNTNSGAFAFTPTTSQLGTNVFVFRAIDSSSLTSAPVTMVVVVSDQADEVAVSLGAARIVAEEGIATVQIPVKLAFAGTAAVQFRFVGPASGTAQRGIDFNCQTQLLVSGSSSGNLLLNVVDDDLVEGPESIIVQMIPVAPASAGVMTQAVLYIRDNDSVSVLAGNITSGNNQQYVGAGTRILQALLPDVALLQEFEMTNGTTHRAWVNETFGTNFHYYVETEGTDNIPNGIVSRWPILDSGEWTDPLVGDRDFAWATIDVPGTQHLHAVSVHLKASSGYESTRTSQARSLTNNVALKGWLTNGFVVIGGDFNLQVRTETALKVLTNIVSDMRQSADQVGNRNTNSGRDNPYDLVLPSYNLDARNKTYNAWGYSFPNGIVFDTRITWANGLPPPALADDSADFNMQHMAAMKVFELEITSTSFMQNQVITFPAMASMVTTNTVKLAASASSGLPVSYRVASGSASIVSVSNLVFSGAGTVAVVASQAGNAMWNPAPEITNTISVAKASQAIEFPPIDPQAVTNTVELFAASTSGLEVQFEVAAGSAQISPNDELSFSAAGTVKVVARQGGNAMWDPAPAVTNSVSVAAAVITNAPVEVPVDWIAENFPGADAGEYESIVTNMAANGKMSVWETYVAGLDPNNPTSVLAIAADAMPPTAPNPGEFILQWPSASGRVYRIGSKTNLMEPFIWINVPATPPMNTHTDTPPAGGAYYRIGVTLEP